MVGITFLHIFIYFQQIIKNYKQKISMHCVLCLYSKINIVPLVGGYYVESNQKKTSIPFILIRNCKIGRSNFKNMNMK